MSFDRAAPLFEFQISRHRNTALCRVFGAFTSDLSRIVSTRNHRKRSEDSTSSLKLRETAIASATSVPSSEFVQWRQRTFLARLYPFPFLSYLAFSSYFSTRSRIADQHRVTYKHTQTRADVLFFSQIVLSSIHVHESWDVFIEAHIAFDWKCNILRWFLFSRITKRLLISSCRVANFGVQCWATYCLALNFNASIAQFFFWFSCTFIYANCISLKTGIFYRLILDLIWI